MSFCRGRLLFDIKTERDLDDLGIVQSLNFEEESDFEGDFENEVPSFTCIQDIPGMKTPTSSPVKPNRLWDSGLGSPTPTTPSPRCKGTPRSSIMSPIPFNMCDSEESMEPIPTCPPTPFTPPHKKFKSLRLYDTPHTPKSLLQKAQRRIVRSSAKPSIDQDTSKINLCRTLLDPEGPQTNVNPFTPESPAMRGRKRTRPLFDGSFQDDAFGDDLDEDMPSNKKLALREINTSRYNEEFFQVSKLGDGEFGSVFKCVNRLDGCTYAIKKSKMPVAGSAYERNALNEVYAHAVLGKHQHVVRYYSAWAENDHMYIQDEFCNGGSLADAIAENEKSGQCFEEAELKQLLVQVAQGLKYIHSQGLVHLDIKPGNIFLHRNPHAGNAESGVEEDLEEEEWEEPLTYKIGDLGHVTSMSHPLVEEGDCRFLPKEILQEDFSGLPKADVFSLALTVYMAGGGVELPKNGDEWHEIRNGTLPKLSHCSDSFNYLLQQMIAPNPSARPSAGALIQHTVLCTSATKTKAQLRKELNEERFKNELLTRKLQEAEEQRLLLQQQQQSGGGVSIAAIHKPRLAGPCPTQCRAAVRSLAHPSPRGKAVAGKRLIGKKCSRSISTTCF